MVINLIDERSGAFGVSEAHEGWIGDGVTRLRSIVVFRNEGWESIKTKLRNACGGAPRMWLLRILAHGGSGVFTLGRNTFGAGAVNVFEEIRPWFSIRRIGIALHACGAGSVKSIVHVDAAGNRRVVAYITADPQLQGRGPIMLRALSRATNVPVRAGIDFQYIVEEGERFRFEGTTLVAYPDGSVERTSDPRLSSDTAQISAPIRPGRRVR